MWVTSVAGAVEGPRRDGEGEEGKAPATGLPVHARITSPTENVGTGSELGPSRGGAERQAPRREEQARHGERSG